MKCLFIANYIVYKDNANGVAKKIKDQILSLRNMGVEVDYVFVKDGIVYFNEDGHCHQICQQGDSFHKYWDVMLTKLPKFINKKYDLLYMRMDYISSKMLQFLKYCKININKRCLEIPTFQHKPEPGARLTTVAAFYFRKVYHRRLHKYIDRIVTFSDDEFIYKIPTIRIENCISNVDVKVYDYSPRPNELNLIGVAMMTPSHGFDRVIRGISEYYKNGGKDNIKFYVVGDGNVKGQWQKNAEELNVADHVVFTGKKDGEDLNELFSKSNIAVASLAIFRKKCNKCSELKIREYFLRGIPFIYSANEPSIEKYNEIFCKKVEHNESPIDISDVIEFAHIINYGEVSPAMHSYAINNFRWEQQFQKIIDELGG